MSLFRKLKITNVFLSIVSHFYITILFKMFSLTGNISVPEDYKNLLEWLENLTYPQLIQYQKELAGIVQARMKDIISLRFLESYHKKGLPLIMACIAWKLNEF